MLLGVQQSLLLLLLLRQKREKQHKEEEEEEEEKEEKEEKKEEEEEGEGECRLANIRNQGGYASLFGLAIGVAPSNQ